MTVKKMREREGSEGGLEQGGHEMSSFGFNRRSQIAGNEFPLIHDLHRDDVGILSPNVP